MKSNFVRFGAAIAALLNLSSVSGYVDLSESIKKDDTDWPTAYKTNPRNKEVLTAVDSAFKYEYDWYIAAL